MKVTYVAQIRKMQQMRQQIPSMGSAPANTAAIATKWCVTAY